jgi:O-6-methylguanine DNA methyltransferase
MANAQTKVCATLSAGEATTLLAPFMYNPGRGKRARVPENEAAESSMTVKDPITKKRKTTPTLQDPNPSSPPSPNLNPPGDLAPYLKKIALSERTPYQKRVLSSLCQVPRGQYSTYGVLAKHLSSSPRAVGNALRDNPFAPMVPCHRILASGGGLGGFKGSWGKNGQKGLNDGEKVKLLRDEGVRFDGNGRVVGKVWDGFK